MANTADVCKADTIEEARRIRENLINELRSKGTLAPGQKEAIEVRIKALVEGARGKERAQAMVELATVQRVTGAFEEGIRTYERGAAAAKEYGDASTEFKAWIGVARSHLYFTRNHGAAAAAFERAVLSASEVPTRQQRYEMFDYQSQLQTGRGELEAGLLNALQSLNLANDDGERFYACIDAGDALEKMADSCDYRKLIDARTNNEDDRWGACKRAVGAAKAYYQRARDIARGLGWGHIQKQAQDTIDTIDTRLVLIDSRAAKEKSLAQSIVFDAQDVANVLVNENFASGGIGLSEGNIARLIEEVAPTPDTRDPRGVFLRGVLADLRGNPKEALPLFENAAKLLSMERASYFDLRQRGTIMERSPELIRDLGLRLLAFRRTEDAFLVFESMRSRGLESLVSAFQRNRFTDAERQSIAQVVQLDSLLSAKQNTLVEKVIAGRESADSASLLGDIDLLQKRLRELQSGAEFQSVRNRLESATGAIPTLGQLKESVTKANIPVLLYWVTATNVLVWAISPKGVEVKTVFLPEDAVIDKVSRLRDSCSSPVATFDDKAARELGTYLLKPFARHLGYRQAIVVAQGPLTGLPFEALIDAEDGKFFAEKMAVSYAPSAASAIRALEGKTVPISSVRAIYDEEPESGSHEIARMKSIKAVTVEAIPSAGKTRDEVIRLLGDVQFLHLLLHGQYNYDEALQSTVSLGGGGTHKGMLTAAELLASNWHETYLAVFSSCESALLKMRISNEGYGLSWPLLAGGAKNVLLSRWRVNAVSNADWMENFYRALLGEATPALAANAAMVKMVGDKRSPYYWAGPQVFGR